MPPQPGELRGIFGAHGDSPAWLAATANFPNGVPRFPSKAAAERFMIDYNAANPGSNPTDPSLKHIFTMLTDWNQIQTILMPQIDKVRALPSTNTRKPKTQPTTAPPAPPSTTPSPGLFAPTPAAPPVPPPSPPPAPPSRPNVFATEASANVLEEVQYRLNVPFHNVTTPVSTTNTLAYLFHHMKCGIFVMIKNGTLQIFSSFVNKDYSNTWGSVIKLEGDDTVDGYCAAKAGYGREEDVTGDRSKWWANGNIICNELVKPGSETQYWGDQFLSPLRDMLVECCRTRDVPDCEFFINKRDYPQVKVNIDRGVHVEPYGFIYDKDDRLPEDDVDLPENHRFETLAPVMSFYAAKKDRFTDIPWPSSEDWEGACGEVFCNTFIHQKDDMGVPVFDSKPRDLFTEANFQKFKCDWGDKVDTAFFRGTATGGGTTIDDNQRLKVAHYAHVWKDDAEKGGAVPFCDAAIVGWNLRDKKTWDKPMTFLRTKTLEFDGGKQFFTPIYMQSRYKYLIYVDGHCAACRYGFMMRLGSVILKVESRQVADTMWYFPLLKPYVDHVPVKEDLSDLETQIRWCREHDEECKKIAANALSLYSQYVARDGLLDYLEVVLNEVAKRFTPAPKWWQAETTDVSPPALRRPTCKCFKGNGEEEGVYCARCQSIFDEEEDVRAREQKEKEEKMKNQMGNKDRMRERMREKMAAKKQKLG